MQNIMPFFSHKIIKKLDKELEGVFTNAPHLPKKAIDILAKIAPYLTLVSALFLLVGGLRSLLGSGSYQRIIGLWTGVSPVYFYLIGLLQILAGTISLVAYKPLQARQLEGWYVLFCLSILNLLTSLVSVFFFRSSLFGLLIGLLINLYLLYELKGEYSAVATLIARGKESAAKTKKTVTKKK